MFPKGKPSTAPSDQQAKEKLASYVYEYLIHSGATKAAQIFLQEIRCDKPWPIGEFPGFLQQWWCIFYDLYSAAPERRETFEHSSEAKAFHDYGFVNPAFQNGLSRNPSIASPINGGMPPSGGRPPSSQGILAPDNGIHTPVSIPGGPMMVPGHYFAQQNHAMSNLGGPGMDMMRSRGMMHPIRYQQGPPLPGNYHPGALMNRHRFNPPQSSGIAHSPGPSGAPQTGPPIMPSPNDNELQQQNNTPGQDSFNQNVSSRSPSHSGMSQQQPGPAFPPPPASENNNNNDSQSHNSLMNGGSSMPQFSSQNHTMEYMPPFDQSSSSSSSQMKNSPQIHNASMNEVLGSMNIGSMSVNDFCPPSLLAGGSGPLFSSDHASMRASMAGMPPQMSQMHMMQQQGLGPHHGSLSMQSMVGVPSGPGVPPLPGHFINSQGVNISASPQFPDYAFTSMSQAI